MRALLVQAASRSTYWGYQHALAFVDKDAPHPPLGLATLAAHLPAAWELRLHDLHLGALPDEALRWADVVLASGMLVQADGLREVLSRARGLGRRAVAGGPAPTSSPEDFPEAAHVFRGEAEGRLSLLLDALTHPVRPAPRVLSPPGDDRPVLALARVPRFDLLRLDRYASLSLQVSRGCPFQCEFCDIIEVFGRVPRVKSPEQVLAELEALRRLGARGPLFVVDDNFIGNRRATRRLLPAVAAWQRRHGSPFDLYTEASLDLATDPALVAQMVDAGFSAVFVGLESSDPDTLARAGKRQNLRVDPAHAVTALTRAGLEVYGGFIVGFDGDDAAALARQARFVAALPVPRAMVGLLTALPGTALWRRLAREGRLRARASGDQFDGTNFETTLPERELVAGYRALLAGLFEGDAYFERCARALRLLPARRRPRRPGALRIAARAAWQIGVRGDPGRRRWFWRLLGLARRRGLSGIAQAITFSIVGEHFVRYTAEEVLPRLDARLAELASATAAHVPRAARPVPARPLEPGWTSDSRGSDPSGRSRPDPGSAAGPSPHPRGGVEGRPVRPNVA
jgi:radical SAM superfamily enzyme YgiQ (UPF0313 family)